jgi:hypothetical protein
VSYPVRTGHRLDGDRYPARELLDPAFTAPVRDRPPVWLLDIDGVLNAVTGDPDGAVWPREVWRKTTMTVDGARYRIRVAQPVLDFLLEVHRVGAADIRWHSSWQDTAPRRFGPRFALPRFPVQPASEFAHQDRRTATVDLPGGRRVWWKVPAAERVVTEEHRVLLWTDDELRYATGSDLGAVADAPDRLLLGPPMRTGLSLDDLAAIRRFLGMPAV